MADKKLLDDAKKLAGYRAVEDNVKNGQRVGIGSGSTVKYVVDKIKELGYTDCICVPTSFQSRQLIIEAGLKLSDLSITPELDITIDGADEVDQHFNLIKGGGGCQLQEKIVAHASKELVIVADYSKDSVEFGQNWKKGIPIEVHPMAYVPIIKQLSQAPFNLKATLRMAVNKAGPVVTDNGNFVLDATFQSLNSQHEIEKLNVQLKMIPGVVEHGLFINMTKKVYFGQTDGTIKLRSK
ncbi:ribose-5-phosphate isomerase [Tieghemostelium lacteum]|uniref:ribose-5-phosphate isomerase n=1 Tax=Tieghemostelium lacteum TaxID=361077 RepID=A0A151Z3B4_TIELA|nr:ribose-5-phosphate isomerase [Tieghemostelium lacteum]|eukprot:KYQ88453.1 ribose-5-phosphate isomerase [Tieghemostelium lacteum]